jgi:hypothetical protein
MLVIIQIRNPTLKIQGLLRRYLFRVDRSLYAGDINQMLLTQISNELRNSDVKILKRDTSKPFGIDLICGSEAKADFHDIDGIRLLKK